MDVEKEMNELVEHIGSITDFREALKLWVRAKEEAIRLGLDFKVARSATYLDMEGKTHYVRRAEADVKNDELAWEAEHAKTKATALYSLALHLRGGEEEESEVDVDLDEL